MCLVLLSMVTAGTWWIWGLLGALGFLSSLCEVLMHRYGYSLAYACEKLWQETGLRSGKCCWQSVCSPRITGWATSCSSSFASDVLPTVIRTPPWTPACHLFFIDSVFLPPSCIHRSSQFVHGLNFYFFPPALSFVTCHRTKLAPSAPSRHIPCCSPALPCTMSCSPCPALWFRPPVPGNWGW